MLDGSNKAEAFKSTCNPTGQGSVICDGNFVVWESADYC